MKELDVIESLLAMVLVVTGPVKVAPALGTPIGLVVALTRPRLVVLLDQELLWEGSVSDRVLEDGWSVIPLLLVATVDSYELTAVAPNEESLTVTLLSGATLE